MFVFQIQRVISEALVFDLRGSSEYFCHFTASPLSREYYLYEIILIWFQFIKWKECVRQSALKRSGIWTVIESIPSQLIYVIWWETSVVQFVQRKWRLFTLLNRTKQRSLNEAALQKAQFGFPRLIDYAGDLSPHEGGRRECLAVESNSCFCVSCLVYWFSVAWC